MSSARQQIIEATCELMESQGYHATGLSDIIRESGAPKGSLYYYFPGGKEELAAEAVRHTGEAVEARIRTVLRSIDDPAEAVSQFVLRLSHHVVASDYRAGGPITTVALESATTSDAINAACQETYESWAAAFAEKLACGGFSKVRARRLAGLIIAVLEGAIVLARTAHSAAPLVDAAAELAFLLRAAAEAGAS